MDRDELCRLWEKYSIEHVFTVDENIMYPEDFVSAITEAIEGGHLQPLVMPVESPIQEGALSGWRCVENELPREGEYVICLFTPYDIVGKLKQIDGKWTDKREDKYIGVTYWIALPKV